MFSFAPIDRRSYRTVMLLAIAALIIIAANIPNIIEIALQMIACRKWGSLCPIVRLRGPDLMVSGVVILFMITISIATLRRVATTPISIYWVLFILALFFADHSTLTGFDKIWNGNPLNNLYVISAPWFLISALSLVLLLSLAPDRSTYFMHGYWNADPPLGWALSVSSFWLLALSLPKILVLLAEAIGNQQSAISNQQSAISNYSLERLAAQALFQLDMLLPTFILQPLVPSAIFSACVMLLIVLGRIGHYGRAESTISADHRLHIATHSTKAARRHAGYKF